MRSGPGPAVVVWRQGVSELSARAGRVATRSHASSPPTTAGSPYVTLQPAGPGGGLPGDASDPADLWGGAAAVVAILVAIVLTRLAFRRHGAPLHVAERDDPAPRRSPPSPRRLLRRR